MPALQVMTIRKVSFEYIGQDNDIDLFFKAAINDYFKVENITKGEDTVFGGSVENPMNKGNRENIYSYE